MPAAPDRTAVRKHRSSVVASPPLRPLRLTLPLLLKLGLFQFLHPLPSPPLFRSFMLLSLELRLRPLPPPLWSPIYLPLASALIVATQEDNVRMAHLLFPLNFTSPIKVPRKQQIHITTQPFISPINPPFTSPQARHPVSVSSFSLQRAALRKGSPRRKAIEHSSMPLTTHASSIHNHELHEVDTDVSLTLIDHLHIPSLPPPHSHRPPPHSESLSSTTSTYLLYPHLTLTERFSR
jgi:hypothetical protein